MATENCEGRLSLSTTSPLSPEPDCSESRKLVGEWLTRFATNAGHPIYDDRAALWRDEFSGVDPRQLERAFRIVLRTHAFSCIPTIGQIWVQLSEERRIQSLEEQQVAREKWLSNQPPWEDLHRGGKIYCEGMRAHGQAIAELQRGTSLRVKPEPLVTATRERLAELEEQGRQILAKYSSPAAQVGR